MSREIELHLAAEAEIEEAGDYLNERTPGEGARFTLAVDAALEAALRSPRTGQLVELKRSKTEVRRKAVQPHDYQVVYAVYDERILVLAVAHNRRRPLYWRDRVPK
ncbi:MAG TPA: type II toxin-antitoxin system RelE/ParE family toxin [Ilumatobacteraceae bacterium]|nr:type II toxin-antitoxin system RelE/ParE family toxin [Ilumatobacteraceae bacterium]